MVPDGGGSTPLRWWDTGRQWCPRYINIRWPSLCLKLCQKLGVTWKVGAVQDKVGSLCSTWFNFAILHVNLWEGVAFWQFIAILIFDCPDNVQPMIRHDNYKLASQQAIHVYVYNNTKKVITYRFVTTLKLLYYTPWVL